MNHFRDGIVCLPMRPDSQLHHFPKVTKKSATTGWNHNFRAIQRNDDGGSKENSYGTTIGFQDRNRYYFPRIQGHDDPCHRIVHYLLIPRIHVARFFHFEKTLSLVGHMQYILAALIARAECTCLGHNTRLLISFWLISQLGTFSFSFGVYRYPL
uniref:Uncharacterized protein n=1 Tax=Saccharomyces cerevisiae TaxID=4932 RepID=E9PAC8_YEASX|nr:unknown [Saccharomyces cerevisiae]prf//2118403C ORF [Saccharomyces cerevisiae]